MESEFSKSKLTIEGIEFARKIQDCKVFREFSKGFEKYVLIAKVLEKDYKCSGLCT
jgi:hypothetical protein